jgi:hypothetical protein
LKPVWPSNGNRVTVLLSNSAPRWISKRTENKCPLKDLHKMFKAVSITPKKGKQSRCPSTDKGMD